MSPQRPGNPIIEQIQNLIQGNFAGRDELYAVADSMKDDARAKVCHRLADRLADHAVALQQIVAEFGEEPAEPLDIDSIARTLFDVTKQNRGEETVLHAAAEGERQLINNYDRAITLAPQARTEAMLLQQRANVELGEQVLRGMALPVSNP